MNTFKYILKRILIGVGIALALMLIKGNLLMQVNAKSVLTHKAPFESYSYNNTVATFTTNIDNPFFQNAGVGNLYFTFAVNKSTGNSTFPISIIRSVVVFSGNTGYVCNIGSSSLQNSTYGGVSYSAQCPMNIGSNGITKLVFYPSDLQTNDLSIYRWTNEGYYSFETDSSVNITVDTSSTNNAINNQTTTITNNANNNTNQIINNQNQNTQDIINNQNELLGNICDNMFNINNISSWSGANTTSTISNNELTVSGSYFISYLVNVKPNTNYYISANRTIITDSTNTGSIRIFNINQSTPITSHNTGNFTFNSGNNTQVYILFYSDSGSNGVVKFSNIQLVEGTTSKPYCKYGSATSSKLDDTNNKLDSVNSSINNVNNTLTNSNVNPANDYFSEYIEDFDPNTHGLTRIVLAPLQLIDHLLSAQCTSLTIPLPFVNQNITIPCMSTIYTTHFSSFLTIYRLITDGIIGYWVCVNVFRKVKGFLDPTDDKVEVFDL